MKYYSRDGFELSQWTEKSLQLHFRRILHITKEDWVDQDDFRVAVYSEKEGTLFNLPQFWELA